MTTSSVFSKPRMSRCITFQDSDVLDILKTEGRYVPNPKLLREKRSYDAEKSLFGGSVPIWCFANNGDLDEIVWVQYFSSYEFWIMCSGEMSIGSFELQRFACIELLINRDRLHKGVTHVNSPYAHVFKELLPEDVVATYQLSYIVHPSYPIIIPMQEFGNSSPTFSDIFYLGKERYNNTKYPTIDKRMREIAGHY